MKARRSGAKPEAKVRRRGRQEQIERVAVDAAQEVAPEPEVALEVTNARFDGGTAAEAVPVLALGVSGGAGGWHAREQQFGGPKITAAAIAPIVASGGVNITKNGRFENHRTISQKRRWLW